MKLLITSLAVALVLSACGGAEPPPQVVQDANGNPVALQQQKGPSFMEMMGASMAGNMLGNILTGGGSRAAAAPSPTYVNRTVVNKTVIVQQAPTTTPKVAPPPPKVSTPTPAPKPSFSAPSRSSGSSYRPSFSSGSRRR
jgi:hypothetical protein